MRYNQIDVGRSKSERTARLKKIRRLAGLAGLVATMSAFGAEQTASAPEPSRVVVYPSAQTIPARGKLPPGASNEIVMNSAIGGHDGAWIVVKGADNISAQLSETNDGAPSLNIDFGHFVKFGAEKVPDALIPWDGSSINTEEQNQPIYIEAEVPYGTKPGVYEEIITVEADGTETEIPIDIRVFNTVLPKPNKATPNNPLTSFNVSPQTYINTAANMYEFEGNEQRQTANNALYSFLAEHRISPGSWGFGEPRTTSGYSESNKWWQNSAQNMLNEAGQDEPSFSAMRIPISNNRTAPHHFIAGLDPAKPETWCKYLGNVRSYWNSNGWLKNTVPYLYGQDEPGLEGQKLVERQAEVTHKCFPESKVLLTGNPSPTGVTDFLANDVDIWSVLASRTYGLQRSATGVNRSNLYSEAIAKVRKQNKSVWSYTYNGPDIPGYKATEPLSNPRMFMLWNALEDNDGTLYTQGVTTYDNKNPLRSLADGGEHVLLYPGQDVPIASARLEQILYGLEDWAVLKTINQRLGASAVRNILGGSNLFSADQRGVNLACRAGCELVDEKKFAWPKWSKDSSTAQKIANARLQALKVASK